MGTVDFPHGFQITTIHRDYVVGITRDALDVEYVRLHRLLK